MISLPDISPKMRKLGGREQNWGDGLHLVAIIYWLSVCFWIKDNDI